MLSKLVELIEGGFVAQLILVVLVWGAIAIIAVTHNTVPDPLYDAGFVIVGFFFRSAIAQQNVPPKT